MKYNPRIVLAYFAECGLPEPLTEYQFAKDIGRKWRFDFAWDYTEGSETTAVDIQVALEVQGGLFVQGGHVRGGYVVKEHEKRNEAAARGWRIIYTEPKYLCCTDTVNLIKRSLNL